MDVVEDLYAQVSGAGPGILEATYVQEKDLHRVEARSANNVREQGQGQSVEVARFNCFGTAHYGARRCSQCCDQVQKRLFQRAQALLPVANVAL